MDFRNRKLAQLHDVIHIEMTWISNHKFVGNVAEFNDLEEASRIRKDFACFGDESLASLGHADRAAGAVKQFGADFFFELADSMA